MYDDSYYYSSTVITDEEWAVIVGLSFLWRNDLNRYRGDLAVLCDHGIIKVARNSWQDGSWHQSDKSNG